MPTLRQHCRLCRRRERDSSASIVDKQRITKHATEWVAPTNERLGALENLCHGNCRGPKTPRRHETTATRSRGRVRMDILSLSNRSALWPWFTFLDVTRSVPVALWFALHKYTPFERRSVMGASGPPDPDDVPVERVGVRYVPIPRTRDTSMSSTSRTSATIQTCTMVPSLTFRGAVRVFG